MNEAASRRQTATEPATQLECSRLCVEGIDHERPAADESCRRHTPLRNMLNEARRGSTSGPANIGREFDQRGRHGMGSDGWPVRIDRGGEAFDRSILLEAFRPASALASTGIAVRIAPAADGHAAQSILGRAGRALQGMRPAASDRPFSQSGDGSKAAAIIAGRQSYEPMEELAESGDILVADGP